MDCEMLYSRAVQRRSRMLNPWFSLSVQALRFGLEAQNAAVAGFMRLANGLPNLDHQAIPAEAALPSAATSAVPPLAESGTTKRAIVRNAVKVHKRTRRKGRLRK
jgi:hypothetical protein